MKTKILLCIITSITDFSIIDRETKYIQKDLAEQNYEIIYTYTAQYSPYGFTEADSEEMNTILKNHPQIEMIRMVRIYEEPDAVYPRIKVL